MNIEVKIKIDDSTPPAMRALILSMIEGGEERVAPAPKPEAEEAPAAPAPKPEAEEAPAAPAPVAQAEAEAGTDANKAFEPGNNPFAKRNSAPEAPTPPKASDAPAAPAAPEAPAAPTPPKASDAPALTPKPGEELDSEGFPWDERIHAGSKAKVADGTFRKRRGLDSNTYEQVRAELRSEGYGSSTEAKETSESDGEVAEGRSFTQLADLVRGICGASTTTPEEKMREINHFIADTFGIFNQEAIQLATPQTLSQVYDAVERKFAGQ